MRGLFAAGFKKWREYVKHPIDRRAPQRPEAVDKEHTITEREHISTLYITWLGGSSESRMKGSGARESEGRRVSPPHPHRGCLKVGQCILVGGRVIFSHCIVWWGVGGIPPQRNINCDAYRKRAVCWLISCSSGAHHDLHMSGCFRCLRRWKLLVVHRCPPASCSLLCNVVVVSVFTAAIRASVFRVKQQNKQQPGSVCVQRGSVQVLSLLETLTAVLVPVL